MARSKHHCLTKFWVGNKIVKIKLRKCENKFKTNLIITLVHPRPAHNCLGEHRQNLQPQFGLKKIKGFTRCPEKAAVRIKLI
jgi:hypothetical protein